REARRGQAQGAVPKLRGSRRRAVGEGRGTGLQGRDPREGGRQPGTVAKSARVSEATRPDGAEEVTDWAGACRHEKALAPAVRAVIRSRAAPEGRSIMWFSSWLRIRMSNRAPSGRTQRRQTAPRFRPRLEAMEERALPSTYYAATASDLIADISAANKGSAAN